MLRIFPTKEFWTYQVIERSEEDDKNFKYFEMLLHGLLPSRTVGLDSSRLMIVLFCVNSIELIQRRSSNEKVVVDFIYSRQSVNGGFDGGAASGFEAVEGQ